MNKLCRYVQQVDQKSLTHTYFEMVLLLVFITFSIHTCVVSVDGGWAWVNQ